MVSEKESQHYKLVLEALGLISPTNSRVRNRLNKAAAQSDDPILRGLIDELVSKYQYAGHVPSLPLAERTSLSKEVAKLASYCNNQLGRNSRQ